MNPRTPAASTLVWTGRNDGAVPISCWPTDGTAECFWTTLLSALWETVACAAGGFAVEPAQHSRGRGPMRSPRRPVLIPYCAESAKPATTMMGRGPRTQAFAAGPLPPRPDLDVTRRPIAAPFPLPDLVRARLGVHDTRTSSKALLCTLCFPLPNSWRRPTSPLRLRAP